MTILALLVAYLAATQIGLELLSPVARIAVVWPAAGVLAGGLALTFPRDRPWLLASAFVVVLLANLADGASGRVSVAFALANMIEGLLFLAVYRVGHWPLHLGTPRQIFRFVAAAAIACGLSGVAAILLLSAAGASLGFDAWSRWFVAVFIGVIAIGPPFLTLNSPPAHRRIDSEALLVIACGAAVSAVIFLSPPRGLGPLEVLPVSIIFPILLWCGARCSPYANAILSSLIALLAIYAIGHDLGPFSSLGWPAQRKIVAVQNFVLVVSAGSLLLSILFTERREREAQLASALKAQKLLLYEVNHRVKNSLQLVTSILTIEASKLRDPATRAALQTARSRIDIIARLHRRLYSSERHAVVDLGEVLRETAEGVLRSAGRDDIALVASIEPGIWVDVGIAAPISLAMAEIVTNSVKHAYRDRGGPIHLALARAGQALSLKVRDEGPGFPEGAFAGSGDTIGMRIVTELFKQVDAAIETEGPEKGASYTIRIPHRAPQARPDR
ncbi:MAG: histidine kinase dimerization/phosphoacceptor domain -containing protein [Sphingomonadales bacterium]